MKMGARMSLGAATVGI